MTELTGVGARLKEARESQGLAIDDVAQQLKFAPRQIESLEHERFDRLPGPTIARGMVRNYARLLKLDPEPLVERMAPQVGAAAPDPGQIAERFRREVPFSDGAKRSTLIYAGFSIGLLALVGVLAYEWQQQKAAPEFVAPARERVEPPAEPAPAAAVVQAPPVQAPAVVAPPPAPTTEAKKTDAEKPAPLARAEPEPALPPGVHRITLRCEEESWIEVKDGAGRTLIASLNPAGTERVVRGQAPFEIVIGNAAHVKMTYDGKPVDLKPHTRVAVARFTLK